MYFKLFVSRLKKFIPKILKKTKQNKTRKTEQNKTKKKTPGSNNTHSCCKLFFCNLTQKVNFYFVSSYRPFLLPVNPISLRKKSKCVEFISFYVPKTVVTVKKDRLVLSQKCFCSVIARKFFHFPSLKENFSMLQNALITF